MSYSRAIPTPCLRRFFLSGKVLFCQFLWQTCLLLQTYGLQLKDSSAVEMCTFVRKVQEDSAAESAGLTTGEPPTHPLYLTQAFMYLQNRHTLFYLSDVFSIAYHTCQRHIPPTQSHTDAQTPCKAMLSSPNWLVPFFASSFIVGDIIVTINGISIEGSSHQRILDLIRESTNSLKWVTET